MMTWVQRARPVVRECFAAVTGFALVAGLGFALLIVLFKAGVFGSITILFYRGVVLCGVAFVLTAVAGCYGLKRSRLGTVRDGFAAACLSLGLNLAFLVLVPVTVDRSVSVFMLAYMDAHAGEQLAAPTIEAAFDRIYVRQLHAIDRRLAEQIRSGNVEAVDGAYQISARGRSFIASAQLIAWLFDTDPRLLLKGVAVDRALALSQPSRVDGASASGTPR